MFGNTKEEKKKRKKWFQSLSLISSEEENDDEDVSTSNSNLLTEVQNANFRFPYPIFSDDSDEEIDPCVLHNHDMSQVTNRSRSNLLLDPPLKNSHRSVNKQKQSSCKRVGHVKNLESGNNNKFLPRNQRSISKKSKSKVFRDEAKRVWNYTKRRKKQHVYHRPGTVLSTSGDESEPDKKKRRKVYGRKPSQLRPSSSEENLDEDSVVPKSELNDNCYQFGRSFCTFLDSSSNSEISDCKENKSTTINKRSLSNLFHDLSSSNHSTDTEHSRNPTLNKTKDSEFTKNGDKTRKVHSISSCEEESKNVLTFTSETKNKRYPSSKRNTHITSKHPFRNLITAQQLQEDNRKMKIGLKPTSQTIEQSIDTTPIELQNQPSKKVDSSAWKKKADLSSRTDGSHLHSSHGSKLKSLKKHFISSNQYSVELSKQIRSNMNLNKKDNMILNSDTIKHKMKQIQRSSEVKTKEGRSNSNSEETTRVFSNDGQELHRKEPKYTVNVNVYCNSNQSDTSRSVPDTPEDHTLSNTIGKEPSHNLDINLSVIQEEEETKSTSKKVRISHINQSKNKLENKPILCESNSESKLNKNNRESNRVSQSNITSNDNKRGQFDLVGNIISQMKINPYPCQKGRRESLDQGPDALGWFSNPNPAFLSTQAPPMIENSVCDPNKGPAQYSLTLPSSASQPSFIPDTSYHPILKRLHTPFEHQDDTISKRSFYTNNNNNENNSSLSTKADKDPHPVSPLGLIHRHSTNEVIVPFYSANHNDYVKRLEHPQNNADKRKLGSDSENVEQIKLSSGDRSTVQCYLQGKPNLNNSSDSQFQCCNSRSNSLKHSSDSPGTSKTSKENFSHRKSESGLSVANINNTKNSCTNSLLKTYDTQRKCTFPVNTKTHEKNNGKIIANKNSKHVNDSSGEGVPIMPHNNNSFKGIATSKQINSQSHQNVLDCEQSALKKGIRIRIQGNEFLYKKINTEKGNSEDSSLKSSKKTLTTDKPVSVSNLMEQSDSSLCDQERNSRSLENNQAKRENLTAESSGAAIVGREEIQNSYSSDSGEDTSSSDESSSSSASSDSKSRTGESDSSDSSSSKMHITEQEEEKDHAVEASSFTQEERINIDREVITLDSSSGDEIYTSIPAPMNDIVNVEQANGLIVQNKVDCVELQSISGNTGAVKSIFDPVESCEPPSLHSIECETHDASISAVVSSCTNSITNNDSKPSSSTSFVGKIRVKSLKELGVGSEILQPDNALQNTNNQNDENEFVWLQPNTLTKTTNGSGEKTQAEKSVVDIPTIGEPSIIKLSKVSPKNKKSLYKVQSTIHAPKEISESPTKIVKNKEKRPNTIHIDNTKHLQKIQTNENVAETHSNVSLNSPVPKTQNSANLLCVKTGENSYRLIQQESNQSKADKQIKSLLSNVSTVPQNSQIKKPIPNLLALKSNNSVFLIPVTPMLRSTNQIQSTTIMQPPSAPCEDGSNRSVLSLEDGQHSSANRGETIINKRQERSPEDIAVSSTMETDNTASSKQNPDKRHPQQTNTHLTNPQSQIDVTFFKLCDELFTEVVCLKIPKMVDDLHLTIVYDGFKEERLKKTEQLLSPETVLSEKSRAERDFNEQLRIRAHSFVPLFTTVVNKINKSNLKTLVMALYIRFINQLQKIDPKYAKYRLTLRHIIKSMLQKSGSTTNDVCQILSDNDSSFTQNYLFIEKLLNKYDLYVEQRQVQQQINNQEVCSTDTNTNERRAEPNMQQSKENNIQHREKSTIHGSFSCSTPHKSNQNSQEIAVPLPENVTGNSHPVQIQSTNSNIPESIQHRTIINLDDLMFETFFKQT